MACEHLENLLAVDPSTSEGCEDCLRTGSVWIHLRLCMGCGHVGCCDASPNRHATAHRLASGHPVVQSLEPGEDWAYCYVHKDVVEVEAELARTHS